MHQGRTSAGRTKMQAFGLILAIALFTVAVQAAPGDLDPTFSSDGKVTTTLSSGADVAYAVAIQADGKIIAVGTSSSGFDFALARYNVNGTLDASFGTGGKVTTDIGGAGDGAAAVAIQPDGKIVAAGSVSPGGYCCQIALARYNADGTLDTSFDGDGKVMTPFAGMTWANAVAVQVDGKLVVTGGVYSPWPPLKGFALARYNSDGSLDGTFGDGGKVITDFGGLTDAAGGIAIQTDGKILAAGRGGPNPYDFALARYNTDGSLDTSFGGDGMVLTEFGGYDWIEDMEVQADGKIIAAGFGGWFTRFALARYNPDGSLDSSFDGDGTLTTEFFGENIEGVSGLAVQPDGKLLAVGTVYSTYDPSFAVARYNSDGTLDSTFSGDGKLITDFGNPTDVGVLCPAARKDCSEDKAFDIALQPDGRFVVVGGAGVCGGPCTFAVARYLGDIPLVIRTVTVDVKPGGYPNTVSLKDRGRLPVAILGSQNFSPTQVDPGTIVIGGIAVTGRGTARVTRAALSFADVNNDGYLDLVAFWNIPSLVSAGVLTPAVTTLMVEGQLWDGTLIRGTDTVKVVQ